MFKFFLFLFLTFPIFINATNIHCKTRKVNKDKDYYCGYEYFFGAYTLKLLSYSNSSEINYGTYYGTEKEVLVEYKRLAEQGVCGLAVDRDDICISKFDIFKVNFCYIEYFFGQFNIELRDVNGNYLEKEKIIYDNFQTINGALAKRDELISRGMCSF